MIKMNIEEFKRFLKEDLSYITSYRINGCIWDCNPSYLNRQKKFAKNTYRFKYHNGLIMWVDLIPNRKIKSDYWDE